MEQEKKTSISVCKMEVVPDPSGRGYKVQMSGDCSEELEQIKTGMGPQGWRYLEKRLMRDK